MPEAFPKNRLNYFIWVRPDAVQKELDQANQAGYRAIAMTSGLRESMTYIFILMERT